MGVTGAVGGSVKSQEQIVSVPTARSWDVCAQELELHPTVPEAIHAGYLLEALRRRWQNRVMVEWSVLNSLVFFTPEEDPNVDRRVFVYWRDGMIEARLQREKKDVTSGRAPNHASTPLQVISDMVDSLLRLL